MDCTGQTCMFVHAGSKNWDTMGSTKCSKVGSLSAEPALQPITCLHECQLAHSDKSGYAQCIFSIIVPGSEPVTFDGRCPGQIVPARGLTWVRSFMCRLLVRLPANVLDACLCYGPCAHAHVAPLRSLYMDFIRFRPEKLWLGPHFPAGRI